MVEGLSLNSLLHWFPAVQASGVPHPRTEIVDVGIEALASLLDGRPLRANVMKRLQKAGERIGYPLFLRTDLLSAKHNWRRTCFVPDAESLWQHIAVIVEQGYLIDIVGLPSRAIVLREYVPLVSMFTAFNGMPVAKERRYFVRDGEVICCHPYWPADAIEEGWSVEPLPENWRDLLTQLNAEDTQEVWRLTAYAAAVGQLLPGAWSVDFACAVPDRWLLIDMAVAAESWHPEDCPLRGA